VEPGARPCHRLNAYDASRLQGKQACRRALQAELGLQPTTTRCCWWW
jgi:hypothetical protein